jgi:hypothetical protein
MSARLFSLTSFELAWTEAAFDAIYPAPPRSRLPHGVASMGSGPFLDDVLARVPLEQSVGIRLTLWMIALAPLFTIRKLGTIASIDAEDRGRVLDRLVTSPVYAVRQLAMSFKALATLLYAKSDAVRTAMMTPVRRAATALAPTSTELVSAARLTSRVTSVVKGAPASTPTSTKENDHAAA